MGRIKNLSSSEWSVILGDVYYYTPARLVEYYANTLHAVKRAIAIMLLNTVKLLRCAVRHNSHHELHSAPRESTADSMLASLLLPSNIFLSSLSLSLSRNHRLDHRVSRFEFLRSLLDLFYSSSSSMLGGI